MSVSEGYHPGKRQRIDKLAKRTDREDLEAREKLQEIVRQPEYSIY